MITYIRFHLFNSLIILFSSLSAQYPPKAISNEPSTFIKSYGEKGKSRGVTVEQTRDGGFIITGNTTDGDHGAEDVLLIKTDPYGGVTWRRTYGGNGEDSGWSVRECADGGYIVVGYTNSHGNGGMDILLIRTNRVGEEIWTKTFGGTGDEYGWDVQITKDRNYIIASQTNSIGAGEIDAYLLKVNQDGNELWSQTYGGDKTDRVFSVQEQENGGFLAAGITYSYESINSNDRDGYLIKTDSQGKQLWYKVYGEDKYDVIHALSQTNDNGHVLIGYGESYSENGGTDVYFIKNRSNGELEWKKTLGGINSERGIKGIQTKDGGFIAIGFTEKDLNLFVVKTDKNGIKEWDRSYGEPGMVDFGYTVKQTTDGGYIMVGHTENDNSASVLLIRTNHLGKIGTP